MRIGFVGAGDRAAHTLHRQIRDDAQLQTDRPQIAGHHAGRRRHRGFVGQGYFAAAEHRAQFEFVDFMIAAHQRRDQLAAVGLVDQGLDEFIGG